MATEQSSEEGLLQQTVLWLKNCKPESQDEAGHHPLDLFIQQYRNEREFAPSSKFAPILEVIAARSTLLPKLNSVDLLRILTVLRVLARSNILRKEFVNGELLGSLAAVLDTTKLQIFGYEEQEPGRDRILLEIAESMEKLSNEKYLIPSLVQHNIPEKLVPFVLNGGNYVGEAILWFLIRISEYQLQGADRSCTFVDVNIIKILLDVLEEHQTSMKRLATQLLKTLCIEQVNRDRVQDLRGIPLLLKLLHSNDTILLTNTAAVLELLGQGANAREEILGLGGIGLLLGQLRRGRNELSNSSSRSLGRRRSVAVMPAISEGASDAVLGEDSKKKIDTRNNSSSNVFSNYIYTKGARKQSVTSPVNKLEDDDGGSTPGSADSATPDILKQTVASCRLKASVCALLACLARTDANAHQIRENNGVYLVAFLTLPLNSLAESNDIIKSAQFNLQMHAFRALRFIFSIQRNRKLFRALFLADQFELFLQIPHYCSDINKYQSLTEHVNMFTDVQMDKYRKQVEDTNINRDPIRELRDDATGEIYCLWETLGSGAFGSVFRARKKGQEQNFAIKEIFTQNLSFYEDNSERDSKLMTRDAIENEARILQSLRHDRIVRYFTTINSEDAMYLVMELVQGATLREVIDAIIEKDENIPEARVWRLFIQLCTALQYLHKEINVVHRDLKPANIMLDWNDNLKVADFGLARLKLTEFSLMKSFVGSVQYSSPEILERKPYGPNIDIWAAGCILYEMTTLKPTFPQTTPLKLAKQICEGNYTPMENASHLVRLTVRKCLTVDSVKRPDIDEISAIIAPKLLTEVARLSSSMHSKDDELQRAEMLRRRYRTESLSREKQTRGKARSRQPSTDTRASSDEPGLCTTQPMGTILESVRGSSPSKQLSVGSSESNEIDDGDSLGLSWTGLSLSSPTFNDAAAASFGSTFNRPANIVRLDASQVRVVATDPVNTLLHQMHKLVYITQLPPCGPDEFGSSSFSEDRLSFERARVVVDRYKRALFSPRSSFLDLKTEMKRLSEGSELVVPFDLAMLDDNQFWSSKSGSHDRDTVETSQRHRTNSESAIDQVWEQSTLTYNQLRQLMEHVLVASGYYKP
eukprot:m.345120 g.345120  ORF g.345120 m.345120 type:complete len:1100 (+) comp25767_c0_seq1:143-3442(+)